MIVTGTGLTHLGSAEGRDKMHKDLADPSKLTHSMRMFKMGVSRAAGRVRAKPARSLNGFIRATVHPSQLQRETCPARRLRSTAAKSQRSSGVYLIDDSGLLVCVGFVLGNEFSDHVTERHNYLWLAHSKLRPQALAGASGRRSARGHQRHVPSSGAACKLVWEKPVSVRRTEHGPLDHQSRGAPLQVWLVSPTRRRPRPFLRHSHRSFSDGVKTQKGDVFEIECDTFGLPLRNRLSTEKAVKARVRAPPRFAAGYLPAAAAPERGASPASALAKQTP